MLYLHHTASPFRGFVFQRRQPLVLTRKDDREFKEVKFMTDARYAVGYGMWTESVLTTFA